MDQNYVETMSVSQVTKFQGKIDISGHKNHGGWGSVRVCEPPETLAELVISSVLRGSIDVGNSYLAIIKLLNHFFVFFTDVTHTYEFCFSVAFKKFLTDSMYNSRG